MKKTSLSFRLMMVFIAISVSCVLLVSWIWHNSQVHSYDVATQDLSHKIANTIAHSNTVIKADGQEPLATTKWFNELLAHNPNIEAWLLNEEGEVIANSASTKTIQGEQDRYIYVVLNNGNNLQPVHNTLPYIITAVIITLICGLLVGFLALHWFTRPIQKLTHMVNHQEGNNSSLVEQLSAISYPEKHNEVSQLQTALIDMAKDISKQWDILKLKDQTRSEFIANISHDLRTPMMSIQGYLETLSLKFDQLSPEDSQRYLHIALTQSEKVTRLVQDLFELAKLEYGVIPPRYQPLWLPDIIQEVIQKFELKFTQQQLSFSQVIEPNLPQISADISMVERILTNLIANAVRHTPENGSITLRVWCQDEKLMMELQDSGPGISAELRRTLFEQPSVQDPNNRDNGGLGLIIVRRMLRLHHGDISLIDSTGACFQLFIPISPE